MKKIKSILLFIIVATLILPINTFCYSQDSAKTKYVIKNKQKYLIEKQRKFKHLIFTAKDKVDIIRYSNDTLLRGRLLAIDDSSVLIEDKDVLIKDIKYITSVP